MNFLIILDCCVLFGNLVYVIYSIFIYKKALTQNEATAQRVLSTPESFVPLSEKSKKFINAEIINRGLDPEDFLLVTCMSNPGAAQDHLALLGSEHLIISIPSEDAIVLNIILEKDSLTELDQEKLLKMKFYIGRNIVHAQRYFDNSLISILKWGENHKVVLSLLEVSLWFFMRYVLGIVSIIILFIGSVVLNNLIKRMVIYLYTAFSALDADSNSSDDPEVLQIGVQILRNKIKNAMEPLAMDAWYGILWSFSEDIAYVMGAGMFHPEKRAQKLLDKIENLKNN